MPKWFIVLLRIACNFDSVITNQHKSANIVYSRSSKYYFTRMLKYFYRLAECRYAPQSFSGEKKTQSNIENDCIENMICVALEF